MIRDDPHILINVLVPGEREDVREAQLRRHGRYATATGCDSWRGASQLRTPRAKW